MTIQTASEQDATDWAEFLWDNGYDIGERHLCGHKDHMDAGFGWTYEIVHDLGPWYGNTPRQMPVAFIPCQGRPVDNHELFELAIDALTSPEF